jgi:hypothetical protein
MAFNAENPIPQAEEKKPAPTINTDYLNTSLKRFPFLKEEKQAKETASQLGIEAKALQEKTQLEEKRKALEKFSTEDKAFTEAVEKQKLEAPEFKPTQDNAMDIGGVFSLISTMGVALGGSGKLSSLNALNAMGGMLKGYQSGRKDLFEKEQKIFDKETARIKEINDRLTKKLDQYQKLRVTDKEAALLLAQEIATENPGVIAALINAGKADVAATIAGENSKALIQMATTTAKHNISSLGAGLPKDAKTKGEYQAKYLASKNIEEIESLLNDPKFSKLIGPETKFTPDVIQNLRANFPELSAKLSRLQAIEFEIGGKALTAGEQKILEPIYGWKGIPVGALRTRLAESKRNLENNLALSEVTYPGFKALRPQFDQAYLQTGQVPLAPGGDEKPSYSVNDVIIKGNPPKKYKVIGVVKDESGQIVDYEVEPTK